MIYRNTRALFRKPDNRIQSILVFHKLSGRAGTARIVRIGGATGNAACGEGVSGGLSDVVVRQVQSDMDAGFSSFRSEKNLPSAIIILDIAIVEELVVNVAADVNAPSKPRLEEEILGLLDKFGKPWIPIIQGMRRGAIGNEISPPVEPVGKLDCGIPPWAVRFNRQRELTLYVVVRLQPETACDWVGIADAKSGAKQSRRLQTI